MTVCFFGDGAANQGILHEAFNLAAVLDAAVVFVCENNQWAISTPISAVTRVDDIAVRAAGYGFPGVAVDGNDVLAVRQVATDAVERARAGAGPTLIEAKSYRIEPHSAARKTDLRSPAELDAWRARDPILRFRATSWRTRGSRRPASTSSRHRPRATSTRRSRRRSPRRSRCRVPSSRTSMRRPHGSRRDGSRDASPDVDVRELTIAQALNEALREEMERDPGVFVIGEDIAALGGLFQVTEGLLERYGPGRVIDAPISEAAHAGAGVGAALVGCRPVVELQIADFVTLVMDQIVNHAAKWRYMSGGQVACRSCSGRPCRAGSAWRRSTPEPRGVVRAHARARRRHAVDALRREGAAEGRDSRRQPRRLPRAPAPLHPPGPVPEGEYTVPIGVAETKREGTDVTVVAYAGGVQLALQAGRQLAREGVEIEVVDLRTLKPLDLDAIVARSRRRAGSWS